MGWRQFGIAGLMVMGLLQADSNLSWRIVNDGALTGGADLPAFRAANQEMVRSTGQSINLGGLDSLRLSGSGQFTVAGLQQLPDRLQVAPKDLVLLDLRNDPHGFVNGLPISWRPLDLRVQLAASAPMALLQQEARQLQSLVEQKSLDLWRVGDQQWLSRTSIEPRSGETEQRLALQKNIRYVRIPLTEQALPSPLQVDALVEVVRRLDGNDWLHVHDREGRDRTTLVMTMVDMMLNARNVPFEDILTRQYTLGGSDFLEVPTDPEWNPQPWDRFYPPSEIVPPYRNDGEMWGNNMLTNNPLFQNDPVNPFYLPYDPMVFEFEIPAEQWGNPELTQQRIDFFQTFYAYCRESLKTGFAVPFSDWTQQGIVFELSALQRAPAHARLLRATWKMLFAQEGHPFGSSEGPSGGTSLHRAHIR